MGSGLPVMAIFSLLQEQRYEGLYFQDLGRFFHKNVVISRKEGGQGASSRTPQGEVPGLRDEI